MLARMLFSSLSALLALAAFTLGARPQSACTQGDPIMVCPSQINSKGGPPRIGYSGCPSASAQGGFVVRCSRLIPGTLAVLLYDFTGLPTAKVFQGGVLCLRQPVFRAKTLFVGGDPTLQCDGLVQIDMNAFAAGNSGGLPMPALRTPGTVVTCQWWSRDTGSPFGTNLSNALRYVVAP